MCIGIGGWTFPPWRGGVFYPEGLRQKDELHYASRALRTIEINGTFHSLQKPASFRNWGETAPEGFVFAIKGPRFITNRKDLRTAADPLARFLASGLEELGDKLGPICWQLMAAKFFDPDEIAGFFTLLPHQLDGLPLRHAMEVQHDSFIDDRFVALAREHGVAIAYVEAEDQPTIDADTADFRYARFKKMGARLKRGYPPDEIERIAALLGRWAADKAVFAYCINGAKERAPAAAMALAKRLREMPTGAG